MNAKPSTVHIRVDDDIKDQATQALASVGISMSNAVRLFLRRLVVDKDFLLELKQSKSETREAKEDSDQKLTKRKGRLSDVSARQLAFDTFETEAESSKWLRTPHPLLSSQTPLEALKTPSGARRVEEILLSIKYCGVV